jgi:hypothetical protein
LVKTNVGFGEGVTDSNAWGKGIAIGDDADAIAVRIGVGE